MAHGFADDAGLNAPHNCMLPASPPGFLRSQE